MTFLQLQIMVDAVGPITNFISKPFQPNQRTCLLICVA